MFHVSAASKPNMSHDSPKPVPPLTCRKDDGTPYTRFADVEAEIAEVWPRPPSDWIALTKKLKSETLVFLTTKGGVKDDYIRGQLQAEVNARTIRISKARLKRFDLVLQEEMALEVESQIFALVWSEANCAQAEYLEVNFADKVRKLTANVIERYKNSVMGKRDQLDVWTGAEAKDEYDPIEMRRDVPDGRPDSEAIQILLEDDSHQDELLQFIAESVKDPQDFLALYLFHAEEMSLAEVAAELKTEIRQVRDAKDRAMHQIRVALGIETEEKREALRKLRNARRAAKRKRDGAQPKEEGPRAESRNNRPGSQSPTISL